MEQFLPDGISIVDIITLMAGLATFLTVIAVWNAALAHDPMRGRLKALSARRAALKSGYTAAKKRAPINNAKSMGFMKQVVNRLNLMKDEQNKKIGQQMAEAGIRSRDAIVVFMFFKLVLPIIIGIAAFVALFGFQVMDWPYTYKLIAAVGSMLVASMGPDFYIKNTIQKRQHAMRKGLPDALDLLVICAEAGLTLDSALQRVARENERACPELADEFSLTAIELGFLQRRRDALSNLAQRVPMPAIKAVVATLIQSEKYGTPLAQSLRVLSSEFRNERMMRAEEKAARLPAIMTVPLIVFIMPTLFVVLIGPAACSVSDQFLNAGIGQ